MAIKKLLWATAICCAIVANGQTASMEYTGELQTDFNGKFNFVNMLRLDGSVHLGKSVTASLATISTVKTRNNILDDLQGFSNIEADNMPLAIAVAGLTWKINDCNSVFAGIRRIDEDYFTSDVTSLFTHSSCGIYPTLSCNYPVATFPDAAMGLHFLHNSERWTVQASVYNGTAHHRFTGRDNVFRICPSSDGVLTMAQASYHTSQGGYFAGAALHYGDLEDTAQRKARTTLWASGEQQVGNQVSLFAAYSHALASDSQCRDFAGAGVRWTHRKVQVGLFTNYAHFGNINEWTTELTCKWQINDHIYLQPALHYIVNKKDSKAAGLLRMGIEL